MPKGIYIRTKKTEGKAMSTQVINESVQKVMDSNSNICFNCTHFKLKWNKIESIAPLDRVQYKDLTARCTYHPAINESIYRGNAVHFSDFLYSIKKVSKVRKNCIFFELG